VVEGGGPCGRGVCMALIYLLMWQSIVPRGDWLSPIIFYVAESW
jgi:hypothetical protein